VTPDVNGYLFAPQNNADAANCITTLLNHRSRWADMGAASLRKVEMHTRANTIQRYLDWYNHVRQVDSVIVQPAPVFNMSLPQSQR
jgi:glycosyltransferase involved in cell wall biosynthesis